jgi:hypothetical protein
MHLVRRHLRLAIWLALLALATSVLLPTLAHSGSHGGGGFAEICTPQGLKLVPLADGEQAPPTATVLVDHCPFCAPAGAAALLPSAPATTVPVVIASAAAAPPFLQPLRALHAWASAQPRAPPVLD